MTAAPDLVRGRGKSGLHEARVPGNARRGQPQGKRHREESALLSEKVRLRLGRVMVKRRGKSPPRTGQPGRHGKPHPEQCRIGASRGADPGPQGKGYRRRDASAREARVGSWTPPVTAGLEEWSSIPGSRSGGDRTRLTGHPRTSAPRPAGSGLKPGPGRSGAVPSAGIPARGGWRLRQSRDKRLAPQGAQFPSRAVGFAVDSGRALAKRRASRIFRETRVSPWQERRLWRSRRRSRSV